MASERKVVVQGGGKNLYKVSEYGGWFHAYHVKGGFAFDSQKDIGKARSLGDALELIKTHSGREILSVE